MSHQKNLLRFKFVCIFFSAINKMSLCQSNSFVPKSCYCSICASDGVQILGKSFNFAVCYYAIRWNCTHFRQEKILGLCILHSELIERLGDVINYRSLHSPYDTHYCAIYKKVTQFTLFHNVYLKIEKKLV